MTDDLPLEDSPYLLDEHGPVFIIGCPRSGTTFLSSCIGAMPGIEEFVGVLVPPRMMHMVGASEPTDTKQLMAAIRDVFWQAFWRRVQFRGERLTQLARRRGSLIDVVRTPALHGRIFCYKEPFLCFAVDAFAEEFPRARFIHIIRDGRDNADSMVRTYPDALTDEVLSSNWLSGNKVSEIGLWDRVDGFNFPWWLPFEEREAFRDATPFARYLWLWREMTERARGLQSSVAGNRYLEVRYEEFVQAPIEHGHRIRTFLERPNSRQFERRLRRAFADSVGISTRQRSADELATAEQVAGDLLRSLGYLS